MEKTKRYYVGFDIGTSSVGWAVTDDRYKLYKHNGHKMWGVRLFDEANTAEARRIQRTERRRLKRRNARIDLLQELMAEEIYKVDPGFYQRLEDSKFYIEDKTEPHKHNLFVNTDYNDVDFYKEFPTIYHLRAALMKGEKEYDIRLVYLAIHHILKNRGHFLYEGDKFDTSSSIEENIKDIFHNSDVITEGIDLTDSIINNLKEILLEKQLTKRDKKKKVRELFGKSKQLEGIFGLAVGTKEFLAILYSNDEYKELESKVTKISFNEKVYDDVRNEYEEVLGDKIILIDTLKRIYDAVLLNSIKEEGLSLSESKIELYNKHRKELKQLKVIIKNHSLKTSGTIEIYKTMFSEENAKVYNYKNYIGHGDKKCSRKDFYNILKKVLKQVEESEEKDYIMQEIELDNYLPLQRVKENGVIPYQVHQEELEVILDNASSYLEFLNTSDGKYTIKEKIMKIMTFRIPYYIGPINTYHHHKKDGFAWAHKRNEEKIYPWNFEEIVDLEASYDEFIGKMRNKCTYLRGKNVIPKNSLLYSEFRLLNEINNLRCNGEKISVDIRNKIIDKMFKDRSRRGKITVKKILEFLVCEGECESNATITGIDIEVKADLKSYRDFKVILGDNFNYEMVEDIIKWITLYGNEKKLLKKRMKEKYPNKLSAEQISKIYKLKYNDWGRLSKEFLTDITCEKFTDFSSGEIGNIINALRNTTNNLMHLLSNEYDYQEQISKINKEHYGQQEEVSYELLDDLYVSPGVKRMIWQSILIMEEIKKIMGVNPEKIFIETIRSNKAKRKRTDTRKKRLIELYSACKEDAREWKKEIEERSDGELRSKKLYLYYLQMGKCMYSGEIIDLNELMSGRSYDIDHIYPRSKVKDDSFDNLVLVKEELNRDKTDSYPIKTGIQTKMKSYWDYLYAKGFISTRKYERLVRKERFKDNELGDFINRQLIETSQSTKAVAEIMQRIYADSNIVYVKAENVSDFRRDMEFIKVREINDLHHANDAYLNIVVGNVYHTKFTKSPINFIKDAGYRAYSLNKMFDFKVERSGYIAWDGKGKNSYNMVKSQMRSNDIRISKRVAEQKGKLFDLTVYKKGVAKIGSYLGVKNNDSPLADVTKYGGVTSISIAYLMPYSYVIINKKGIKKHIRKLVGIPVYLVANLDSEEKIKDYVLSQIPSKKGEKIEDFKLINAKLRIGSLIKYNGFYYYVGGRSDDTFYADNAIQLIVGKEEIKYLKEILKFKSIQKTNKDITINKYSDLITQEKNNALYDVLVSKLNMPIYQKSTNNKFEILNNSETRIIFNELSIENQINILLNILNLLTNNISTFDFKSLGFNVGRRKIGFNISDVKEFKLINQSVTGLFYNDVDLMV